MSEKNIQNVNIQPEEHEPKGDKVHFITAHLEHLMDIFEIGIAVIVAFGFIISVFPLLKELPLLASMSTGTESYRHFLENALDLVIGIEFIKMLIKHTPGSVVEVLLFALSRHMVLEGGNAMENLLTVCAIALIFVIRKFLFIDSFEFLTEENKGMDWLSDWKEIRKGGASKVKAGIEKEKTVMKKKKASAEQAHVKKENAKESALKKTGGIGEKPEKSEPITGEYREVNAEDK